MTTYTATPASAVNSTTLSNGDSLIVESGGIADNDTLGYLASAIVSSGGRASATTVGEFSELDIQNGGTTDLTTLVSGGFETVSSGGIASRTNVVQGAQTVSSGGLALFTTLSGSSEQDVYSGTTSNTVVGSGAIESLIGGIAVGTTIAAGGMLSAFAATLRNTVINGGTEILASDAIEIASNTIIEAGGSEIINAGTSYAATVGSDGVQEIGAGGSASGTRVASGGTILIEGGTATAISLQSGATEIVASGTTSGTVIGSGVVVIVSSGATLTSAVLSSGGAIVRLPGALVNGTLSAGGSVVTTGVVAYQPGSATTLAASSAGATIFGAGGDEYVLAGGTASGASFGSGATQTVYSGGVASGTSVTASGGFQVVSSGGSAIGTVVSQDGELIVSSGGTAHAITVDAGFELVSGGTVSGSILSGTGYLYGSLDVFRGTASSVTIGSGGYATISNGSLSGATVESGGILDFDLLATGSFIVVSGGGVTLSSEIGSGTEISGTQVHGGGVNVNQGIANATTVFAGGAQGISLYGTADGTVLSSGGIEEAGGGTVSGTTVSFGATQLIETGSALGTLVRSGGGVLVSAGAVASAATLFSGGVLVVLPGGTASGTVSSGGAVVTTGVVTYQAATGITVYASGTSVPVGAGLQELVLSRGIASNTIVNNGGQQIVYSGGVVSNTTLSSGYLSVEGGLASGLTVGSGANATIGSGGSAANVVVQGGGLIQGFGQTITNVTVSSGGEVDEYAGSLISASVLAGGSASTESTGSANLVTVGSGGNFTDGGTATGTVVKGSATENVGGTDSGTAVSSGGTQNVYVGGTADGATISFGAVQFLQEGTASSSLILSGGSQSIDRGTAIGTRVDSGGFELLSGGATSGTVVSAGGMEAISAGTADGTILLAGGRMTVGTDTGGSITSGTVISSGGYELVSSGSTAIGTILDSGGKLVLLPGATANGTMSNGGTVVSTGVFDILSGGGLVVYGTTASGASLGSGATEYVLAGGRAEGTTLSSGARQVVFAGGIASGTFGDDGSTLIVSSGGVASNAVMSGATGEIQSGGKALGTDVEAGTLFAVLSSGTASGTQVYSGGAEGTLGGSLSNTTVHSGGLEVVFSGSAVDDTVQSGGALGVFAGTTVSAIIEGGGAESVFNTGAIASGTVLDNGGVMVLLPGGQAIATGSSGGSVVSTGVVIYQVFSGTQVLGTSAIDPSITDGGQAYVLAGGVLSGGSISGGFAFIENLGAAGLIPTEIDVLHGGLASGVTVGSGAELSTQGVVSAGVVVAGGLLNVLSGGIDTATALSGGFMIVSSGGTASGVTAGSGSEFVLSAGGMAPGLVLLQDSTLDLAELSIGAAISETVAASDMLTVSNEYGSFELALSGNYSGEFFNIAPDNSNDGALVTVEGTPCYCRGTAILTDQGEVAVEELRIGDRLITYAGAVRPILWIGHRAYAGRFAAANPDVLPVRIRAGALGAGLPRRDLLVSPLHALFLDGVLIPAAALVNGRSITRVAEVERVEYFHVELETHDVILAEGLPAESFVDDDSRGMFLNAAAYFARYPDAQRRPARFCAERVADGPRLEAVRRRLAGAAPEEIPPGTLLGRLDEVGRGRISGWARDEDAPEEPVRLRILDSGVTIGEVLADRHRPDLEAAGFGRGCHGFALHIPGGLSPLSGHSIEVQRVADGAALANSPWKLPASSQILLPASLTPVATVRGRVDTANRSRVSGWAQDEAAPERPLELQITVNGVLVAQTLANRYRADLQRAGIGGGWHSFATDFPGELSPTLRQVIEVRSARCGTAIAPPTVIDAVGGFDPALEQAVTRAVDALDDGPARQHASAFLRAEAERLRRRPRLVSTIPDALVIDERPPVAGRDGGSQAVLSHMRALERLGYRVSVAAAADAESVEDILRRDGDVFDLVYLHRAGIAARYLALARHHAPRARVIYSVADLHYLRLERQAVVEERPELRAASRRMRLTECSAAWAADAVITHSAREAALLRQAVPEAHVFEVPWDLPLRSSAVRFGQRSGVAFIGNYAHAPNADAARWLVEAVMPLVWQTDPSITCRLAGADISDTVRRLERPGVHILGQVGDLGAEIFDRVRLTVAPLRFGAGVKCKVLESFANATPCVMSENAADGVRLPPALRSLVADDAAGLAARILRLHGDARAHRAACAAGLAMIRAAYSADVVTAVLQEAIAGQPARGASGLLITRRR